MNIKQKQILKDIYEEKIVLVAYVSDVGDFNLSLPTKETPELILYNGCKKIRISTKQLKEFNSIKVLKARIKKILSENLNIKESEICFSYSSNKTE